MEPGVSPAGQLMSIVMVGLWLAAGIVLYLKKAPLKYWTAIALILMILPSGPLVLFVIALIGIVMLAIQLAGRGSVLRASSLRGGRPQAAPRGVIEHESYE